MLGELADRRVVEHRGRADVELAAELPEQPVAEFDRHQRVGAQVEEPARCRGRLGQSQETLHFALEELGDEPHPLRDGDLLKFAEQLAVA